MAITSQLVYNVMGIPNNVENKILITDIFQQRDGQNKDNYILPKNQVITKLDVQGEPGLKMQINNQPIYIGRSGIYSIDNAYITSFRIVPTQIFEYNETATDEAKNLAVDIFEQIEIAPYNIEAWSEKELNDWIATTETQIANFNTGYQAYLQGLNGVYQQKTDTNGNPINEDFYNLIIDYTYEERK